jgi:hypothetical protein
MKIREKVRKIKENMGKLKKKKVIIEPNWQHVLKEPYYMTRTYRGLKVEKIVK